MLKKMSCVVVVLAIFALGFAAGGYFMGGGQQLVFSEAHAGGCVNVTYQRTNPNPNSPNHTCSYIMRFDKKPDLITNSPGNLVIVYFK